MYGRREMLVHFLSVSVCTSIGIAHLSIDRMGSNWPTFIPSIHIIYKYVWYDVLREKSTYLILNRIELKPFSLWSCHIQFAQTDFSLSSGFVIIIIIIYHFLSISTYVSSAIAVIAVLADAPDATQTDWWWLKMRQMQKKLRVRLI